MALTYAQLAEKMSLDSLRRIEDNTQKKIDENEKIFMHNCQETANEIVKITIKAINDYINQIENPVEVKWFYGQQPHMQSYAHVIFSEEIKQMLKSLLFNKIDHKISQIIFAQNSVALDNILIKQFEVFGFIITNRNTIYNIVGGGSFSTFLVVQSNNS